MKIKKESKLFITNGLTLYIGSIIDTIPHKHNAMQITFPVEGDFTIEIEHKMIQTKSMIIRSKCSHRLVGKNGIQMFIFVEPESVYSDALKAFLGDMSYKEIPIDQSLIETLESEIMNHKSITKVLERILSSLQLQIDIESSMDERIKRVLEKIETIHEKKILIQNLANHVSLSESRLQHLFKSQIGISIKKYLQWKRLVDGVHIILEGKDFTFAAYEAGFSDSAHMSRVFKEMFGINLIDIFHTSQSIQVYICKN